MKKNKNNRNPAGNIIFLIIALAAFLFFTNSILLQAADDIRVGAISNANKSTIRIGERFNYSTIVSSSHDIEVDMPKADKIGVFEIKDHGIIKKSTMAGYRIRIWYELVVYETGKKTIPGLTINYRFGHSPWHSIKSNAVNIYVQSVFEISKIESDIHPIEKPIGLRFPYTFHIIAGVFSLFVFSYFIIFFIKYRKYVLEKRKRGLAVNLQAYRKLSDRVKLFNAKREFKTADFIGLAGLIRGYLGFNFHIDYKKFTTEEFLHNISRNSDFYVKYGEELSFILRVSDMVKFANYIPEAEECKRALVLAQAVIKNVPPNGL
jgi:hypothetical protein